MTQLAVAKELQGKLGIKHPSSDATLISDYQRIERTGRTSRLRAEVFAEIFKVPVAVLQGEAPPDSFDYLADLASLLRQRLLDHPGAALVQALKRSSGTQELTDEAIRNLAEDIGVRVEAAQLGRNPSELEELSVLTGLPQSELLRPVSVLGHWLVIANGPGIHCTEFILGALSLARRLEEILGNRLEQNTSDATIRMFHDEPWVRIEVRLSTARHEVIRIDCVRCDPMDKGGLRWVKATWRDRSFLESWLPEWAFSAANFVTDFGGHACPTGDVRRLRLVVTEHSGGVSRPAARMILDGGLDGMSDKLLEGFRQKNSTHALVMSWLAADLRGGLTPFLAEFPRECWSVSGGGSVSIFLDEAKAHRRIGLDGHFGIKYRIGLSEDMGKGKLVAVPWRRRDVDHLKGMVEKMIADLPSPSSAADIPRRLFERFSPEN
ncbi:MAG: hypothetical protein J0L85_13125 [Zoogloea sp.]|nr:hypothetical protein [Zoogloea sp.]